MLFSKPKYLEIMLPFAYVDDPEDPKAGIISIEAYGTVWGTEKYCYATYSLKQYRMYENGDYEQMVAMLKNAADQKIRVRFKIKKGIPKDFRIDVDSIAEALDDDRFKLLELASWGLNDRSWKDLISE